MAATIASILAASRPSEKFGTHSTSRFMKSEILRVDDAAAFHGEAAKIHTKIIRDFAVVGHVKGGDVGIFANLERTDAIVLAKRISGVDRGGSDGFRGSHAHLRASQRKNHGHAECGASPGIEVRGDAHNGSGVNERTRGRVVTEPEMKTAAGKERTGNI